MRPGVTLARISPPEEATNVEVLAILKGFRNHARTCEEK